MIDHPDWSHMISCVTPDVVSQNVINATLIDSFAASSEVQYDAVFHSRAHNMELLMRSLIEGSMVDLINSSIQHHRKKKTELVRIHESGDFCTKVAWSSACMWIAAFLLLAMIYIDESAGDFQRSELCWLLKFQVEEGRMVHVVSAVAFFSLIS